MAVPREERPTAFLRTALGNIPVDKGEDIYWTEAHPVIERGSTTVLPRLDRQRARA